MVRAILPAARLRRTLLPLLFGCAVGIVASSTGAAAENEIYDLLLSTGVDLGDGTTVPLPPPTMDGNADADRQQQMLEQAAGRHSLERFTRKSRVAPFELKMKSAKNKAGERTGQIVDAWFIVYATLEKIETHLQEDADLSVSRQPDGEDSQGRQLTPDQLASRQIQLPDDRVGRRESYGYFSTPLLDRVQLSGVTRSIATKNDHSFLAAFVLDSRFAGDSEYPNQWQPITVNQLGEQELGRPRSYSGCGGYVKATELVEPAGALLVELHVVFNEPQQWFSGANLLRSKLPLIVQDRVRNLRGELERLDAH